MSSIENKRIALFPGTFDPFTIGHQSLVRRGLELVDEIVISIGINDKKLTYFSLEKRMEAIWNLYKDNPRVKVMSYNQLTVDFAKEVGAGFILRGIRTVNDFEYEKTIADVNRKLTGIETFILFTEPEHTHISSSIVRELLRYGKDIPNSSLKRRDCIENYETNISDEKNRLIPADRSRCVYRSDSAKSEYGCPEAPIGFIRHL